MDPTVTQSICNDDGGASEPLIELPQNGGGITYSLDEPDYGPGDIVHVIATLSSQYQWATPLPGGWVRRSLVR